MAGSGLTRFFAARYYHDGNGNVNYSDGWEFAQAIEIKTSINKADSNPLYANNTIKETKNVFSNGTLTITTDDLDQEASQFILGVEDELVEIDGETFKMLAYGDVKNPYLGFATIFTGQRNNVAYYKANILPKISFEIPDDAAKTQGDKIEWQTPEITATILRDDTVKQRWKYSSEFQTQEAARRFIKHMLNLQIIPLSVASAEGTETGKTRLVVLPPKSNENRYVYKTGAVLAIPDLNVILDDSWTEWDGAVEVEAQNDQEIVVVEIGQTGRTKKAGKTTATVKT